MKLNHVTRVATFAAAILLTSACGGGDAASGSLTAFSIVPSDIKLTGPDPDTCGAGYAGRVFVYGGAGPYRVDNTGPDVVAVSKSTVGGPGDYVDVTFLGGCFDPINVVFVDAFGLTTVLKLHAVKGAAPPAPPASAASS